MLEMYECVTKCIYELIMRKYGTKSYGPKLFFIVINGHTFDWAQTMQYIMSSTMLICMFLK